MTNPEPHKGPPTPEEWIEAGIVADESMGRHGPAYRKAQEGIRDMTARIAHLEQELKRLGTAQGDIEDFIAQILQTKGELAEARLRLAEYQAALTATN